MHYVCKTSFEEWMILHVQKKNMHSQIVNSGQLIQTILSPVTVSVDASCVLPDAAGKVRIWDTTQKEHPLKAEYQPLGAAIKDIAWSPDNKRIVVGGEGRGL